MRNVQTASKGRLMLAMLIFGTIGIFRTYIPLSSSMLAMLRGFIGTGYLLLSLRLKGRWPDWRAIRPSLILLIVSGALIGLNWILLFEAYRYTSVAVATLCYYMAPVMVILASPLAVGERLTPLKLLCALIACLGMVLVSGVLSQEGIAPGELTGIALGLGAACLYAAVMLINQKLPSMDAYDKTILQLGAAAVVLLPYNLVADAAALAPVSWTAVLLVAVVGIVHTGIAYALYFGAMGSLSAQTVALYSYIDPVAAILLSLVLFRESIGLSGFVGAALILGATLVSDLSERTS